MTVPNQRDPDSTTIIRNLRADLADLKRTVVGRWGRIPHLTADPTSPPNGSMWVRDDLSQARFRSGGITGQIGFGPATAYIPTFTNTTGGLSTCAYSQLGKWLLIRARVFGGATATAGGLITFTLPAGFTAVAQSQPITAMLNSASPFAVTSGWVGASATVITYAKTTAGGSFTAADVVDGTFTALIETA